MIKHFDHVAIVVTDVEKSKAFFRLLGFEEDKTAVISGEQMSRYMGVPGIEAEHHTLVLRNSTPRCEVQLLKYRHPDPIANPNAATLTQIGFNHLCFAVGDLDSELSRLKANGVRLRNEVMDFHGRRIVFLSGPEGIVVELAEWH
jgi:catechol 2,3-dioxygenase-like lactoylglutathione lyase family enzyme